MIKKRQIFTNVSMLASIWLPSLILALAGKPYQRGFYCSDESIRLPLKKSTISTLVLFFVGTCLPITTMVAVEAARDWLNYGTEDSNKKFYRSEPIKIGSVTISGTMVYLIKVIFYFLLGAGICQCATDIGKYSIGRLRPQFIDVCKPDLEILCKNSTNLVVPNYITDFSCTQGPPSLIRESRLSFPSGHASYSAYSALYLVYYLQGRVNWVGYDGFRGGVQAILVFLSLLTGLSRITDHKHHWTDVLSGFIVGIVSSTYTACSLSNIFAKKEPPLLPKTVGDIDPIIEA